MAATATTSTTTHGDVTSASMAPTTGFDELFVNPVDTSSHGGSLPALPDGWQHAGIVERIARQPRERRETILAGLFALVAGLWAPLGVVAFLTRNALLFFGLSAVAVVLGAAPRPGSASQVVGGLAERARSALERVGPALERVGPALERVSSALERVGPALEPVRARLRSVDRRVSAAVRDWLEDLRRGGGGHSTPSSAR